MRKLLVCKKSASGAMWFSANQTSRYRMFGGIVHTTYKRKNPFEGSVHSYWLGTEKSSKRMISVRRDIDSMSYEMSGLMIHGY
jgi:hypothetical protein